MPVVSLVLDRAWGPAAAASGLSPACVDDLAGRHGEETGPLRGGHVDREQLGSM
jgi:hypothetical protein